MKSSNITCKSLDSSFGRNHNFDHNYTSFISIYVKTENSDAIFNKRWDCSACPSLMVSLNAGSSFGDCIWFSISLHWCIKFCWRSQRCGEVECIWGITPCCSSLLKLRPWLINTCTIRATRITGIVASLWTMYKSFFSLFLTSLRHMFNRKPLHEVQYLFYLQAYWTHSLIAYCELNHLCLGSQNSLHIGTKRIITITAKRSCRHR